MCAFGVIVARAGALHEGGESGSPGGALIGLKQECRDSPHALRGAQPSTPSVFYVLQYWVFSFCLVQFAASICWVCIVQKCYGVQRGALLLNVGMYIL